MDVFSLGRLLWLALGECRGHYPLLNASAHQAMAEDLRGRPSIKAVKRALEFYLKPHLPPASLSLLHGSAAFLL
ncbi:hypothetical protein GWK47_018082 [Chionoecetes opilio]|uniref:Uncharacterized protein n=1 Tax=Chionoecetes opilio TaxID=41210 RepID=A0A8J4XVI9_CHIOP|nr:hypothetical protein GWK47_018082 [Chionoecetes opilio]